MEKQYVIYKATNNINGKLYIGKTYNFEKRKNEHRYDIDNGLPFHRALKKYGFDNFLWEIIDNADTDKEAREKEVYWINKLNSCIHFKNSNGYNITIGGEGGTSWNSKPVVQFDLDGNYIDEFISCSCAAVMLGLDRKSIERASKLEYSQSGGFQWKLKETWNGKSIGKYERKPSVRKREIVQLDLSGNYIATYSSVTEASKQLKIIRSNISGALRKQVKTAGGFQWIYKEAYDESKKYGSVEVRIGNGIVQLDKNGNFIRRYSNCSEAARSLGKETKCHKTIHSRLDSKYKSYGYYWLRYETYLKIQQGNTEVTI